MMLQRIAPYLDGNYDSIYIKKEGDSYNITFILQPKYVTVKISINDSDESIQERIEYVLRSIQSSGEYR